MATVILSEYLDVMVLVIRMIGNLSFSTSAILVKLKDEVFAPGDRNYIIEAANLHNFRPISNLVFSSRIVELLKVVDFQL